MNSYQEQYAMLMNAVSQLDDGRHRLTEESISKIATKVEYVEYKKNEKLQSEGYIPKWMYMISKGVVREHCLRSDGVDVIVAFHEAMTGTGSLHSYETKTGALYSLTTITPVSAYRILCSDFSNLLENNLELSLWYGEELRRSCIKMQKHIIDIRCSTSEERLEVLISKNPQLVKSVPDYMLANYLNMTAVSFSRNKKNLLG